MIGPWCLRRNASAVVEVLLATPAAPMLEARLFGGSETLHAPHLLDAEGYRSE
jgi:hypothetical protein